MTAPMVVFMLGWLFQFSIWLVYFIIPQAKRPEMRLVLLLFVYSQLTSLVLTLYAMSKVGT